MRLPLVVGRIDLATAGGVAPYGNQTTEHRSEMGSIRSCASGRPPGSSLLKGQPASQALLPPAVF